MTTDMAIPNARNACAGHFKDWLEVNLTDACNARCAWCVEKQGWHPSHHAPWQELRDVVLGTGRQNIILLGGEPTLYRDLRPLIAGLAGAGRDVWITTNGSRLTRAFVESELTGIKGCNISIHDHNLAMNEDITGILLAREVMESAVEALHDAGASVRLNCNCMRGHIANPTLMMVYLRWAKKVGAEAVRFAELKGDDDGFVDFAMAWGHAYGLNDDPFALGCCRDVTIGGMPVNFRQMCGLQTARRPAPRSPRQVKNPVLYYDGKLYQGWQIAHKETTMNDEALVKLLEQVASGEATVAEAALAIDRDRRAAAISDPPSRKRAGRESGSGCAY